MKKLYYYEGPIESFGKCICNKWKAYTHAVSEKEAANNFRSQFKKENGYGQRYNMRLAGKISEVKEEVKDND